MMRGAALKLTLAALLFAVAGWLIWHPREIDTATADAIAKTAAVRFAATSGQPVVHFGSARRFAWPDGWEFVWTYRPCPAATALRIFVPLSGHGIEVTQQPDCQAVWPGPAPLA